MATRLGRTDPDPTDLEHDVAGALLSLPSTPTMQAANNHMPAWNADDEMDIFTLLLSEMDTTPRPSITTSVPSVSITPKPQVSPQGELPEMRTTYTWADALNSDSVLTNPLFFDLSTTSTHDLEMPRTPTIPSLTIQPPSRVPSRFSVFSSSGNEAFKGLRSPSPPLHAPLINLAAIPSSSSSASKSTKSSEKSKKVAATRTAPSRPATTTSTSLYAAAAASSVVSSSSNNNGFSLKTDLSDYSSSKSNGNSKRRPLPVNTSRSSDEDEEDSLGDTKLSPKSHAIREKNREAVRKCRQKKKEREEALNERIRLLEHENEEIKIQLRLGSEDRIREVEMETNRRAKRLEDVLALSDANPNSPEIDEQLKEACKSYLVHSQERAEDRSAALSGTLSRVSRLIDPTLFAKFYLWHGTAKDDYFTNPNGLWGSISAEMNMTEEQTAKLTMRREKLQRLRAQIMDVSAKLHELQTNVSLKEKIDVDSVFCKSIQAFMTPRQLAKFILWIRKDPAIHEVTKSSETLSSFLETVVEHPAPDDFVHMVKARDDAVEQAQLQSKKSRLEQARQSIIILTKGLWDAPKEKLESIAHQGLTPNVTLIDPNNGGEYHGIAKTLQYVHRIRLAFGEKITVDLREISMNDDKARATWVLQGTYRGRLGAPPNSSEQKHLKHVSFVIVCTYTFQPQTNLIQEMLVAWDAIGLMRQIGLLKHGPGGGSGKLAAGPQEPMAPPPPKRVRPSSLRFEEIQQLRQTRMSDLAKMFAADSFDGMVAMARTILHSGCVFQDSYMGFEFRGWDACSRYAQKVRSPFPTLTVTGVKVSENEGAALGSPIRLDWSIRALYSGPLVSSPTDCSFNAVLFVTFDDVDHTIDSVHFSWNAQRLMDQLGIQRRT